MRMLCAILVLATCLLTGCTASEKAAIESKCDASLRARLELLAGSSSNEVLDVLGKAEGPLDDARKSRLVEAGVELRTVTDDLFVGRIPASRVGRVATLDFVKSLQLAQVSEPLGR